MTVALFLTGTQEQAERVRTHLRERLPAGSQVLFPANDLENEEAFDQWVSIEVAGVDRKSDAITRVSTAVDGIDDDDLRQTLGKGPE